MRFLKIGKIFHVRYRTPKGFKTMTTKQTNMVYAKVVAKEAGIHQIEMMSAAGCVSAAAISMTVFGSRKTTCEKLLVGFEKWQKSVSRSPNTIQYYSGCIRSWMQFSKTEAMNPSDITEAHIHPFINRSGKACASTRDVQLAILRAFFEWMQANGYCVKNPAKLAAVDRSLLSKEQQEPKKRRPFTDEEYDAILKVADAGKDDFWKMAVRIGRATALRLGDIAQLEWASFSESGKMVVHTKKADKRVEIPMTEEMVALVFSLALEQYDKKYVFPVQSMISLNPSEKAILSTQFGRICKKAGVDGSFHCLRHAALSEEADKNGIESAQRLAGHSSENTTRGYWHK